LTTRALSGMRGFFGPDSNQHEQAGGTRKSKRKPPTRPLSAHAGTGPRCGKRCTARNAAYAEEQALSLDQAIGLAIDTTDR